MKLIPHHQDEQGRPPRVSLAGRDLEGHHGRDTGGREHGRHDNGPQATRDPRTLR